MPSLHDLELQLQYLKEHQDFYAQAKQAFDDIPADQKKALAKKWVSKAANLTEGKLSNYPEAQQDLDRKRLIPLPDALRALQQLEEDLVRTQVLDLAQLMWKKFRFLRRSYEALFVNWSGVWKVLVEVWELISPPTEAELIAGADKLVAGAAACAAIGLEAFSAKAFIAVALSVMKERDTCIKTMRAKALPQSFGPRYRRRKRAR